MTYNEIKHFLNRPFIDWNNVIIAETGEESPWMSGDFDNANRVAITAHEDTINHIVANPDVDRLHLQTETRTGPKGVYTQHRIVLLKEKKAAKRRM